MPIASPEDVDLDGVGAVLGPGDVARERVARLKAVGALVADQPQSLVCAAGHAVRLDE